VIKRFFGKKSRLKELGKREVEGINNLICNHDADLSSVEFNIFGNHNAIIIHQGVNFAKLSFNLYGDHHKIVIGKNCQFNGPSAIWAEDNHCLVSIGEDSSFEGVHLSATEPGSRLIIGRDCMFSYDIDLRTGDSHSLVSSETGERYNYAQDIVIGEHVWIASHCILTKGTQIPRNSVVGTGSLVNSAFKEENTVLAGRPARVVRSKVNWLRERIYQRARIKSANDSNILNESSKTVNLNERLKRIG